MLSLPQATGSSANFFWVFIKGKLVYTHDIVVNRIRMLFARLFGDHANSVLII
jgi:hypothetical protein